MLERQTQTVNVNFYIALLLFHKNIICANQILVTPSILIGELQNTTVPTMHAP